MNLNKILMKDEMIEKIKILLSKAELRELVRLELTPGNLGDSLPRRSKFGNFECQKNSIVEF